VRDASWTRREVLQPPKLELLQLASRAPNAQEQARWLNLLAEYQYTVVHIPGRTNPADFLVRKRFRDGQGLALTTGYDDPGSSLELPPFCVSLSLLPFFLPLTLSCLAASASSMDIRGWPHP
jgi:hypothetical protein